MNFPPIKFHKFSKCGRIQARRIQKDNKGKASVIKNLNLIKMVSFLIPDVEISKDLTKLLNETFYEIRDFKVADLLKKNTINGYIINNGDFYCLSTSSDKIKFSIFQKKLFIEIEQDLFFSLMSVHLCKFKKAVVDRMYKFEVDLSYEHIDNVRCELNSNLIDKVAKVFIKWHPESQNVCPSSVAKYFSEMGYAINGHRNQLKIHSQYGLRMLPIPNEFENEEISAFLEQIGMILLACDIKEDNFDTFMDIGRGKVVHWKGLITQNQLNELIYYLQNISEVNFPYIAISTVPSLQTVNCTPRTLIITPSDYLSLS